MPAELSEWPTEAQAAALLGTSVKTINRHAKDGRLELRKRPRAGKKPENVVNPADLDKLLPRAHVMRPEQENEDAPRALTRRDPVPANGAAGEFLAFIRTIATAIETERYIVQMPLPWITVEEAATVSGLAANYLRRAIRDGRIEAVRGGPRGKLRIRRASLNEFSVNSGRP
jgi:excisionase family DNA binding protein